MQQHTHDDGGGWQQFAVVQFLFCPLTIGTHSNSDRISPHTSERRNDVRDAYVRLSLSSSSSVFCVIFVVSSVVVAAVVPALDCRSPPPPSLLISSCCCCTTVDAIVVWVKVGIVVAFRSLNNGCSSVLDGLVNEVTTLSFVLIDVIVDDGTVEFIERSQRSPRYPDGHSQLKLPSSLLSEWHVAPFSHVLGFRSQKLSSNEY